jgi:hypothetical protein
MSFLSWLDYSDRERREALDVIDLFRESDTVDELGLGTIRDAFADYLFPGTSTIQTQAGYFLFLPWVYLRLESKRTPSAEMSARARVMQGKLRDGLVAAGAKGGVIGELAGVHIQRLPSSVYWNGMRRWGILLYPGSEDRYHRSLDGYYRRAAHVELSDDGEPVGEVAPPNWDPGLPAVPLDFPTGTTFQLRVKHAEYLADRIISRVPSSLLAEFIRRRELAGEAPFAWAHPIVADLAPSLAQGLRHAEYFAVSMHGAALLYNLILSELSERETLIEQYRTDLAKWWAEIQSNHQLLHEWDREQFWSKLRDMQARIPVPTERFVREWLQRSFAANTLSALIDVPQSRELIIARERALKRARARVDNVHARELWRGRSGTARLDYRWNRPVKTIIDDIVKPLRGESQDA